LFYKNNPDGKAMRRGLVIAISIIVLVLAISIGVVTWGIGAYNSLVALDEGVTQAWSQVQNQYQRRLDLIPNLVETVRGYAKQEQEVFIKVTEARAKAGQFTVTPQVLNDPASLKKFEELQGEVSSALSRLLAVAENYPNLKSSENFLTLQSQLEGTENRIAVERRRFNEAVQLYNTKVRRFPISIVAGFGGFATRAYFAAEAPAGEAPKVKF
jgi:LemA protein